MFEGKVSLNIWCSSIINRYKGYSLKSYLIHRFRPRFPVCDCWFCCFSYIISILMMWCYNLTSHCEQKKHTKMFLIAAIKSFHGSKRDAFFVFTPCLCFITSLHTELLYSKETPSFKRNYFIFSSKLNTIWINYQVFLLNFLTAIAGPWRTTLFLFYPQAARYAYDMYI